MRIPRYAMPAHPRFMLGGERVHTLKVVDFLRYVIERDQLSINDYLEAMGADPFFLVAATGLGKTVAVPVHVLVRLMQTIGASPDPQPRVWVVEPRIPIAVDQMKFMNSLWQEYLQHKGERQLAPLFGCVSSASGRVNHNAPVQFVTTGIFELMAKAGELTPTRDRVIIDEAHVTIEQNPGVELGIALARKAGVTVDYMSATVDTTTLADDLGVQNIIRADRQRFGVWKHNLLDSMTQVLPEVIEHTLVNPNQTSRYFPQPGEHPHATQIVNAVLEPGRSHGLLATVNSFAGEQSDIQRLTDIIRKRFPNLPVLHLASEIVRDARREREFQAQLRDIEAAKQNYVILATSVVEMGITFPTLDFVVTMDSGYDQETIGDVTFPVTAPLGVNSLLQRIGRVGRRRPGIAYISQEIGAEYADYDDEELNSNKLRYEPIRFPMTSAPLLPLAYYACKQEWGNLAEWVAGLHLPSRLHENLDRMTYLQEQIDMLEALGLATDGWLTPFGERMEQWIGQADIAYAVQLQLRFEEGCELPELMFWIATTALSNTPLVTLRAPHDYFVDYEGTHATLPHSMDMWPNMSHEDLALFSVIVGAFVIAPQLMASDQSPEDWDISDFDSWCAMAGIDGRKLLKASCAIRDLWKLFCRINAKTERFLALAASPLAEMPWNALYTNLPKDQMHADLQELPGVTRLTVVPNGIGGYDWQDEHGHSGMLSQDDTPIRLELNAAYIARLVPSRDTKDGEVTWRAAHLGAQLQPQATPVVAEASMEPRATPHKSLLARLRQTLGI